MQDKMYEVKIILKSGYEITIICKEFSVKYGTDTRIQSYSYSGLDMSKGANPLHIDANEIAAVISRPCTD